MKTIRPILMLALVALTGCFSLGREEPAQQHYVLGGGLRPDTSARIESLAGLAIGLRQLEVADYLRSPLIVVRQGQHEIRFSEFNRWGEELGGGVNRAVAAYLAERALLKSIEVVPWSPRAQHDYLIQLHILRFEGVAPLDSAASEGEAYVLVTWEIIRALDGAVSARGATDHRVTGWPIGDYGQLVSLLDTGLTVLSDDLIAGLQNLAAPQ